VAGVTGLVWRHEVILKMVRRDVIRIQQVETFSVLFMARNAESSLLRTLVLKGHARANAQRRKSAQAYKGENLARGSRSDRGAHEKHRGQHDRHYDQCNEDSS